MYLQTFSVILRTEKSENLPNVYKNTVIKLCTVYVKYL